MIESLAQQQLHMAVIAGSCGHGTVAQQIDAAVPDVGPVGRTLLHQAHGAGRPGSMLQGQVQPDAHHFLVGTAQRQVQKTQGIEQRLRGVPEGLEQDLEGDFGGARTFSVAPHAIHHDQQCGVLGDGHRHPVLVLLPAAEKAQIRVFNLQGLFCLSGTLRRILYHADRRGHQTRSRGSVRRPPA